MNLYKMTISCLLAFSFTTLAFSQIIKPTGKYFQMPAKITSEDYMSKTVILKIKKDYRAQCSDDRINIAPLEQYLNQVGAYGLTKMFPHALPPAQERNRRGERYADLSLIYEFQYTANIPLEKVINRIYALKIVEYTQLHYIPKSLYTPNDPQISSQSHLSQISAYAGWDISKGDTNVVIGITDTGFDINHPDLQDNVKYNYADPIDGADNDNDGYIDNFRGWDLGENDNNPQANVSGHGVHVSGCAAPSTDNGIGVAGPGFNCRLLPIKISDAGGALTQGYAGITYAADHGADIINCSWGSNFGGSLGQDVIDYASINKDALVVGGAGNDGSEDLFYPASFEYVISVAWMNSNDVKNSSSNYGYAIDVCAPGSSILSTFDGGTYGPLSGTSMASPIAAGCAAMIKAQYPFLTALQVGEQLKVSCDDIYPVNGSYIDKLGNGRVNLFTALSGITTPSVVMTNKTITDGNDNAFVIGDTLSITGLFVNYLATTGNINVTLTSTSTYVNIIDAATNLGIIASFGGIADNNADPFSVVILPTAPLNTVVDFELLISDGSYSKKEFFNVTVNVDYINIAINDVATSITSKGLIGFNDFSTQLEGLGFIYPYTGGGINMLFEAGVMIGIPGKVSDWLRDPPGSTNNDFGSVVNVKRVVPNVFSEFDIEGTFNDDPAGANKLDIEVNHKAFAWTLPGHLKYVIVEYNIKNTGAGTLSSLYAGIFADWDIMDYSLNNAGVDNSRNMGYCWSNEPGGLYAGIQVLTSGPFVNYAIDNDGSNGSIDIYTSYNTAEKYTTLSTNRASAGQGDVTHVVSSGPFNIAPGDSVLIAFALLADSSLTGLQLSADGAYCNYNYGIITAAISSTDVTCGATDGTATVTPTSGAPPFTYQWDANAGSQTDSIAIGLDAGSYSVTVTGADGCSVVFTVNLINANTGIASASVVQHVTCFGGNEGQATSSITGGTPPYTYSWDNGDTTAATTSGLTAGDHTIQITDSASCVVFQTITINEPPLLTGVVTTTDVHAWVVPSGGVPPYSYQWKDSLGVPYPSLTKDPITNVPPATYLVTVTDANGCDTTFIAIVGAPIGLPELSNENAISVYPNPNNGQFSIQFNGVMKDVYTIEVRNILGQTVYNEEVNISGGSGMWIQMDLSSLNKGVYLLNVINSTSERAYELIVIH